MKIFSYWFNKLAKNIENESRSISRRHPLGDISAMLYCFYILLLGQLAIGWFAKFDTALDRLVVLSAKQEKQMRNRSAR